MSIDYRSAGVDIEAGDALVDKIKPAVQRTKTPEVLSELGLFGGFYDARFPDYEHPVLVSSADGALASLNCVVTNPKCMNSASSVSCLFPFSNDSARSFPHLHFCLVSCVIFFLTMSCVVPCFLPA